MFEINYIRHDQITPDLLDEIIQVKTSAWPYSYESQQAWINANLKDADIHVLLRKDNQVVAYLNLIDIEIKIDSTLNIGYGIGNVCASEKGNGWGSELISRVNRYLIANNRVGLLFCKDKLIRFYSGNEWRLILPERLKTIKIKNGEVMAMVYNYSLPFLTFEFSNQLF